jgi:hypothetical protein
MRAGNLDGILSKKAFASVVRYTLVASTGMVILSATSAAADDTAAFQRLEAKIQQLETRHENEIKALQAEIRRLRREKPVSAAATLPPPAQPQPSSAPPSGIPAPALPAKVLMTYDRGYHFGFSDATGDNTVELFGRLQVDAGGYTGYNPAPMTLDRKGLSDGVDLRRARIGVIGTFMTDWHYAFVYDFGNSSDSSNINNALASANSSTSPTTSNTFLSGVENAFLTYNGFYNQGRPFPVAFDFGIMDVPWTLEEATSSNDLMFLERSTAQVIATSFGGGDFRSSLELRSNNDRYWLGLFLTGPNAGALHTAGASCNTGTVAVTPGTPCVTSAQMTGLGPQFVVPCARRLPARAREGRNVPPRIQLRQPVRSAHRGERGRNPACRPPGASRGSDLLPRNRQHPRQRRTGLRRRGRGVVQEPVRAGRILPLCRRHSCRRTDSARQSAGRCSRTFAQFRWRLCAGELQHRRDQAL